MKLWTALSPTYSRPGDLRGPSGDRTTLRKPPCANWLPKWLPLGFRAEGQVPLAF